ncbi:protein of unknown function [Candidatus Nitrosocosmicus franklandus]|uniref:Uncharacterized protein n=1 Tax=Candidatus Nitrosocosmicus franklandianus TaxID=1798806 RepID=A0A484I6P7_9ARCH|nr:protein of unknown function [Candidatus Nitrosocosmicus franklandus]
MSIIITIVISTRAMSYSNLIDDDDYNNCCLIKPFSITNSQMHYYILNPKTSRDSGDYHGERRLKL